MVHSEVYLNKYVVSIAPFSTPQFRKLLLFCMFSLCNFSSIFPGGSADPIYPYVRMPMGLGLAQGTTYLMGDQIRPREGTLLRRGSTASVRHYTTTTDSFASLRVFISTDSASTRRALSIWEEPTMRTTIENAIAAGGRREGRGKVKQTRTRLGWLTGRRRTGRPTVQY